MQKVLKGLSILANVIGIFCLVIVLLLTSVRIIAFSRAYYAKQYKKYDVAGTIGTTDEELAVITDNMLDYLKGDRENLDMTADIAMKDGVAEVFTDIEKQHMVDVQWMFRLGFIARDLTLLGFAVFMILAFFLRRPGFTVRCGRTSLITVAATLVLLIAGGYYLLTHFTELFIKFHEVSFTNDLWILDPSIHVLINLVPEEFFIGISRDCLIVFALFLVAVIIVSVMMILLGKRRERQRNS
ncbi:MAG: TIGR01906 family membrane protein [Clostridia bacterium]|nr:TIGR01906 family membrane protein [Clostridia bacterium]